MKQIKAICVYCGSRTGHPVHIKLAKEMGRIMAVKGLDLVYGGGSIGLPLPGIPAGIFCTSHRSEPGRLTYGCSAWTRAQSAPPESRGFSDAFLPRAILWG